MGNRALRCLLPLLLGAALCAQANRVSGIVVAGNGLPVAGARIVAAGGQATVSGPDGGFSLPGLPQALTITAPGYATVQTAAPAARHAARLRIVLRPAALSESVTVTASARNEATAAVPLDTGVIGRARLQASAFSNLDSILREYSGVTTFRENSSLAAHPTTQGIALLGVGSSGASRALVLLDGLPLNDFYGGWVDWLRVPVEDLSSVSVVSGGASPLYGNDALSGVIGIATRAPVQTHIDIRTGGGNLGTGLADGVGVIAWSKWALAVRGRALHAGGYYEVPKPGLIDTRAGVNAQDWAPELRYVASSAAMFTLSSEYFAENRHNGTVFQVNATRLRQIALRGVVDKNGVWEGSVFDQSEDFDSNFSAVAADRNSEFRVLMQHVPSRAQGAALDWSRSGRRWSVMLGGSLTRITAVDNEVKPGSPATLQRRENGRQRLAGAFAEAVWSPTPTWSWTGTLRKDQWRNYDAFETLPASFSPYPNRSSSAWSPGLGTVWQARSWLGFRLSGYASFRAPTLNELYRPFRVGTVNTLGNPDLAAERYRGAQAGAEIQPGLETRLRLTYFDGTVSNLITSVTLSTTPSLITRQRQNLGRVRARGELLQGQWRARPGLSFWGAYSHVNATVISTDQPGLAGNRAPHVPANSFSARVLGDFGGWTASAVERFGGSNFDDDQNLVRLPSFWVTDLFVSRSWGGISPYFAVANLWNRRYPVQLASGTVLNSPRGLSAGVRLQWPRR